MFTDGKAAPRAQPFFMFPGISKGPGFPDPEGSPKFDMKLFITDIDDTLSIGEAVADEVREACSRLRSAGWEIMVATGRTYSTARGHMEAIGVTRPSILYNGGRIVDPGGRPLYSRLMEENLANRILEYVWTLPLELQVSGDERISCRETDTQTRSFFANLGPIRLVTEPVVTEPVFRICLWMESRLMPEVEKDLRERFGREAEICPGGPQFMDIQPLGVSKGSALDRLLAELPTRPEVIVAAGDHCNDRELLRRADVAASPSNAHEALLREADLIIPPVSEHGIRTLIDHILSPAFSAAPFPHATTRPGHRP